MEELSGHFMAVNLNLPVSIQAILPSERYAMRFLFLPEMKTFGG